MNGSGSDLEREVLLVSMMFKFNRMQAYRLLCVKDVEGNDISNSDELYSKVIGCVAYNLRYDERFYYDGFYRVILDFVQDKKGVWINRSFCTSPAHKVEVQGDVLVISTRYSKFVFEETVLQETPICAEKNIIELYLSMDERHCFAKGFYWDVDGEKHELGATVHVGMLVDSVLIGIEERALFGEFLCRYFLRSRIEFYDTLYSQQDYSIPMLIHNTSGEKDLVVKFERYDKTWTIAPGGTKCIVPFTPLGADE